MKPEAVASRFRSGRALQCALLMIALGVPGLHWLIGKHSADGDVHRSLKLERTQLAQSVALLSDHAELVKNIDSGEITLESLTLSIIEALEEASSSAEVELVQLSVSPNNKVSESKELHTLQVEFSAQLASAQQLLPLFDAIRFTADWRPIEIRRCAVFRISGEPVVLQASCSVDVYYFPGVDV